MRIDAIKLGQNNDCAFPTEVTITMSAMEAAQIAKVFGEWNDNDFTKRGWPVTHVYLDLTSNLFNRFWEDGLDGALKDDFIYG